MLKLGTITVVDPTAEDAFERHALAPRPGSLEGATIGLIDNSKRMADVLLGELRDLLREHYGVAGFDYYRKANPSVPTPPEVIQRLVAGCDAVVHGVAD